jgi:hypothetical protein
MLIGISFSCSNDNDNQPQTIDIRINPYQNTGIGEGFFYESISARKEQHWLRQLD